VGATDAVESIDEAAELARALTNGQGADAAIVTVGVLSPDHIGQAFESVAKGGIVVVTAAGRMFDVGIPVSPFMLAMYQKRIQGCLFGMMSPSAAVPRFLGMYEQGQLKLDELISRTYPIEEINAGYDDMYAGVNIRGLIEFPGQD
jgi:Zn-dependent alcohol dehydrogenase